MTRLDLHFVKCNICKADVSYEGKNTRTFNTTNIVAHLKLSMKKTYNHLSIVLNR